MRRRFYGCLPLVVPLVVPLGMILGGAVVACGAGAEAKEPERYALLIGVARYAKLSAGEQLSGCTNDVQAMRQVLVERYGFSEGNVTVLQDDEATGAGIRKALASLSERARGLPERARAQVVVHFSGHGSQIADQPEGDPDCDEEDGLDETLVPHDASAQGGPEDIRDDELYRWIDEVSARDRARVWVVLDCCHSGTGARGATKVRKLRRGGLAPLSPGEAAARRITRRKLPETAVFLSACRDREVEPEYQSGEQTYGLLTRFLVQVLSEQPKISAVSYDVLRQAILARYRQDSAVAQPPTPQMEGNPEVLRGTVLQATDGADRPAYWKVQRGDAGGTALLMAGGFHGVTAGSQFELYEQPDQIEWMARGRGEGKSLAWLEVEKVEGATATGRVFRWVGEKHEAWSLPEGFKTGFAVERFHQHGSAAVRLRVVRASGAESDGPALGRGSREVPVSIRSALEGLQKGDESSWLVWTEGDAACDVLLRIDGKYAALFPATGRAEVPQLAVKTRGDVPASLEGGWGPIRLDDAQGAGELQRSLRNIARARNLLRLAEAQSGGGHERGKVLEFELVAIELKEEGGEVQIAGVRPWEAEEGQFRLVPGDKYALRIRNTEKEGKPWHVTVLQIDADMGISQVLPFQEGSELYGEQQLNAGGERLTDGFECAEPLGPRWAILLATREPNEYYNLVQPALPKVKSRGDVTALDELLAEQTYFKTRGDNRIKRPRKLFDESWTAQVVRWQVMPGK